MDAWTVIAYSAFGVSLLVSALQIGNWMLRANPQAIIDAGRWSAVALGGGALAVLLWLMISGRWLQAMMLAAFTIPVFVRGASRSRALFEPLNARLGGWVRRGARPAAQPAFHGAAIDPALVRQSVAVLTAYLDHSRGAEQARPINARLINGTGRRHIEITEALEVLGLEPGAGPDQIREAHRRLRYIVDPELGGTQYLTMKIDEARDVLLGL